jgi:hypothetical protein
VQGILSVAGKVNTAARKNIFMFSQGQDATVALVRGYIRLSRASFTAGYKTTFQAGEKNRTLLYSQFPKLSDVTAGRYAKVSTPEDYLRESTKNLSPEERKFMGVTVSTDAGGARRVVVYDRRSGTLKSDISFNFTPKATPVTVARALPKSAVDDAAEEVGEIIVTATKAKPVSKEDFITSWSDRVATTPKQNGTFIDEALKGERPGEFYLDTQNIALKPLNETLMNKQLVDSLGNRYNSLVMDTIEDFRSAHPGVTVDFYSDYKSLRARVRGPPGKEQELMDELAILIDRTTENFNREVKLNALAPLPEGDSWFRSGLGRTSEEANIVTRFSRRKTDIQTETYNSIGAQTRIRDVWQLAEQSRRKIQEQFKNPFMLRKVEGTDMSIPTADVLEVVRKNSDPDTIAKILTGRYNTKISRDHAILLQTYFERVDQFSPGLLIPSRIEHTFDQATKGGFTVDFAGVGSVNAEATAMGIAQGKTVRDSLAKVRSHEVKVTEELDALKARTEDAVRTTLSKHGITAEITISGDDMVVVLSQALSAGIRREIAEALVAAQAGTKTKASGMRTSFYPEGIPDSTSRSIQATIGESVEKKLRSRLEGKLSQDELSGTLFAVEMRGTSPGAGGVGLEIVNDKLSPASRQLIQKELQNAILDVNSELKKTGQGGTLDLSSKTSNPLWPADFQNFSFYKESVIHVV